MSSTDSEHLWYQDGLRFRCTQCGNCCTGAPGYVWVDETEVRQLIDYLEESEEVVRGYYCRSVGDRIALREHSNGDCVFYDTNKGCTIYPVRPKQCRTFPFWDSNLESPEAWKRNCDFCPGSGRGDWISVEEIRMRAKEMSP